MNEHPSKSRGTRVSRLCGKMTLWPRVSSPVLWGLVMACCLNVGSSKAAVTVSPNIHYYYSEGPGEGLSVSSDGKFIMVSSPIEAGEIDGEVYFRSQIPHVVHHAQASTPFTTTVNVDLNLGESTDVALLPGNPFGLAVVRADGLSPINALLALRGNHILQALLIPEAPDGMKVSPNGRYAVVAVEKGGEIRVYDLSGGAGQIKLAALVSFDALAAYYEGVSNPAGGDLEPEAVGISSDSSVALVTIQDSSSVAALDLDAITHGLQQGMTPEALGNLALKNVIHLPYGFIGNNGRQFGVEPDGVAISPDGSFAMVAHEPSQRVKHLQGFSVLDLRQGLTQITSQSYCVFDADSSLLSNTGLSKCPVVEPGDPYPSDADKLPRLDPASFKIVQRGGQLVAALVIERYEPSDAQEDAAMENEDRGSVLFLESSQALQGVFPKIDRVPVGASDSHLEVIDSAQGGRWIFVSISNGGVDKGTLARLELVTD